MQLKSAFCLYKVVNSQSFTISNVLQVGWFMVRLIDYPACSVGATCRQREAGPFLWLSSIKLALRTSFLHHSPPVGSWLFKIYGLLSDLIWTWIACEGRNHDYGEKNRLSVLLQTKHGSTHIMDTTTVNVPWIHTLWLVQCLTSYFILSKRQVYINHNSSQQRIACRLCQDTCDCTCIHIHAWSSVTKTPTLPNSPLVHHDLFIHSTVSVKRREEEQKPFFFFFCRLSPIPLGISGYVVFS